MAQRQLSRSQSLVSPQPSLLGFNLSREHIHVSRTRLNYLLRLFCTGQLVKQAMVTQRVLADPCGTKLLNQSGTHWVKSWGESTNSVVLFDPFLLNFPQGNRGIWSKDAYDDHS
jgi:hypothetical protein